jgi:hypothetical protein
MEKSVLRYLLNTVLYFVSIPEAYHPVPVVHHLNSKKYWTAFDHASVKNSVTCFAHVTIPSSISVIRPEQ